MKKSVLLLTAFIFICAPSFAQIKIGTVSKEPVVFANAINGKLAYAYSAFNEKAEKKIFLFYDDKTFGPYDCLSDIYCTDDDVDSSAEPYPHSIEYDKVADSYILHFGQKVYKDIVDSSVNIVNDSVAYCKTKNYKLFDLYINEGVVQKDIISYFISPRDIKNYAYLASKKVFLSGQELPLSYYGSFDSNDENIFNADCLFYKGNEYLLHGKLINAAVLTDNIFYVARNEEFMLCFYCNGNEICKTGALGGDTVEMKTIGKDYCSFILNNEEAKVFYGGKIFTGTASENQIVYVDKGNVYLLKR